MNCVKKVQSFLGFIYPNKCMCCRCILSKLDDAWICRMCYDKICVETRYLSHIKKDKISELEDYIELQEYRPRKIISLFPYNSQYRKAILRWKYRGVRKYAIGFTDLLVQQGIFKENEYDKETVLVPIPLASSRMKKRGFNQALDLAMQISKRTGLPVLDCLKRTRDTIPQSSCTKEERYQNAKKSMCVICQKDKLNVKSIILIDDIYTTGSTIKEAIRAIKNEYIFKDAIIDVVVIGTGDF